MSSATYRLTRIHRSLDDAISMETSRRLPDSRMADNEVALEIASGTRILGDVRPHGTKPANR